MFYVTKQFISVAHKEEKKKQSSRLTIRLEVRFVRQVSCYFFFVAPINFRNKTKEKSWCTLLFVNYTIKKMKRKTSPKKKLNKKYIPTYT